MDDQQIVERLKQSSAAGLSFEAAKEKLLAQGVMPEAINRAADTYQYGSKPAQDTASDKVTEYFKQHPDQAVADGSQLLQAKQKEDARDARLQAAADIAASQTGPDIQSEVSYEYKFSHDVGLTYWQWILIGLLVNGAAYLIVRGLHLNRYFYVVNGILTFIVVIILIRRIR